MKTLLAILLLAAVLIAFMEKTKTKAPLPVRAAVYPVVGINGKINFIPFSRQTKWFNRDLNSHLNFNGKEGC